MGKANTNKGKGSIAALVNSDQAAKIIWCLAPSHYLSRRCRDYPMRGGQTVRPGRRIQEKNKAKQS
jgi:hypothetical protein